MSGDNALAWKNWGQIIGVRSTLIWSIKRGRG
jgi:hypothetical protein